MVAVNAIIPAIRNHLWKDIFVINIVKKNSVFFLEKVNKFRFLQIIEPIVLENGHSQCPWCSKIMKEKSNIARHMLIHTGVKSYNCNECDYSSNQSSNLKKHFNRHHC